METHVSCNGAFKSHKFANELVVLILDPVELRGCTDESFCNHLINQSVEFCVNDLDFVEIELMSKACCVWLISQWPRPLVQHRVGNILVVVGRQKLHVSHSLYSTVAREMAC